MTPLYNVSSHWKVLTSFTKEDSWPTRNENLFLFIKEHGSAKHQLNGGQKGLRNKLNWVFKRECLWSRLAAHSTGSVRCRWKTLIICILKEIEIRLDLSALGIYFLFSVFSSSWWLRRGVKLSPDHVAFGSGSSWWDFSAILPGYPQSSQQRRGQESEQP